MGEDPEKTPFHCCERPYLEQIFFNWPKVWHPDVFSNKTYRSLFFYTAVFFATDIMSDGSVH